MYRTKRRHGLLQINNSENDAQIRGIGARALIIGIGGFPEMGLNGLSLSAMGLLVLAGRRRVVNFRRSPRIMRRGGWRLFRRERPSRPVRRPTAASASPGGG